MPSEESPSSGAGEMRPREGFRPTSPQQAAGIRTEPPPSLPCATGTSPAATAAAAPPEDPPGVRSRSQGLRVGPNMRASLTGKMPYSGSVVVPTITKPASRRRRVMLWSYGATCSAISSQPYVSRSPLTGLLFLIAIGTPAKGRSSPEPIFSAVASAPSSST
jgi:hypothetical protein